MATEISPNDSILRTISKLVGASGLEGTDEYFDEDLLIHINTALFELYQVGIGEKGYSVTGESQTWADYLGDRVDEFQAVKDYIYLSVKPIFDPSASSTVQTAMQNTADRLLYRLREQNECEETL